MALVECDPEEVCQDQVFVYRADGAVVRIDHPVRGWDPQAGDRVDNGIRRQYERLGKGRWRVGRFGPEGWVRHVGDVSSFPASVAAEADVSVEDIPLGRCKLAAAEKQEQQQEEGSCPRGCLHSGLCSVLVLCASSSVSACVARSPGVFCSFSSFP